MQNEPEIVMENLDGEESLSRELVQQVVERARELARSNPNWANFFRDLLGEGGIVRRAFSSSDKLAAFEQTSEYREILQLVTQLRDRQSEPVVDKEPIRMITVRIPKSLHEWLRVEADLQGVSLNRLCISKLLQVVEEVQKTDQASS